MKNIFFRQKAPLAPAPVEEMKIEPSIQPRPVQYGPGDFTKENADMIQNFAPWIRLALMFEQEAIDSANPERKAEAMEIADQVRKAHRLLRRFYGRWEIEP